MKLKTPRGVKDFLPEDANWKHTLEQKIQDLFINWGYQRVITPTFEFFDILDQGEEAIQEAYRFFGRHGELLALRSDLTTPIARMVASRLKDELHPLRLAYIENVFRHDDVQVGFQREFYQAGIELMGSSEPTADAEVAAMTIILFNTLGVESFSLDIGQVQYFHGIMEECKSQKTKDLIRQMLLKQDIVGLKHVLGESDLADNTRKLLLELPQMRGKEEILDKAYAATENRRARSGIANLREIYSLLKPYGVANQVNIDLSIAKSLDYYTGMVLEGYVPSLGFMLGSGGRYDNLSNQFGNKLPAVGFALGLERLMLVLEEQGLRPKPKQTGILVVPLSWEHAVQFAQTKREAGERVEIATQVLEKSAAIKYAQSKNLAEIHMIDQTETEIIKLD